MTNTFISSSRVVMVLCLALCQTGCTSSSISVAIVPDQSSKPMGVEFTRAYYSENQSGEDQIVLVSDPVDDPPNAPPGGVLAPTKGPPLWQVLLIDLHWRNAGPGNLDSPVANNAVLHWYVYGRPTGTAMGVLHYMGQASVRVHSSSSGTDVTVRSGELNLVDHHGPLRDPFNSFRINTTFRAVADTPRLRQVLDDVNKAIGEAETSTMPQADATLTTLACPLHLPRY